MIACFIHCTIDGLTNERLDTLSWLMVNRLYNWSINELKDYLIDLLVN